MENTRLFKIIIIIVWRTQDIKVFSSTNAEGSGGGWKESEEVDGVWIWLLWTLSGQDSGFLQPGTLFCFEAILESNFTAFYLAPRGEEVRGVAGGGRGVEGSRSWQETFPPSAQTNFIKEACSITNLDFFFFFYLRWKGKQAQLHQLGPVISGRGVCVCVCVCVTWVLL